MTRAFLVVTLQTFKNRMLTRIRRLRNPRYLLSTLAGLAYLWMMFFRRMTVGGPSKIIMTRGLPITELTLDIGSVVVLILMIGAWALPEQSGGLEFSEAEIQFLFAAPLRRRDLLLYKLFRSLPGIFMSTVVMSIFGFRRGWGLGLFVAFSTLSVYFMMTALGRARLKLIGIGAWWRLFIIAAVFAGISALATWQLADAPIAAFAKELGSPKPNGPRVALDAAIHRPPLGLLLIVPRIFATLMFPPDLPHFALAVVLLVGMSFLFFTIAARLNIAFEEASIGYSQKRRERRERMMQRQAGGDKQVRKVRAVFRLSERGRPEVALLWKNLNAAVRVSLGRLLTMTLPIGACVILVVNLRMVPFDDRMLIAASLTLFLAAIVSLLGPIVLNNDLRLDLPRLDAMKTWPLSGESIVAAEIAAPLAILATVQIVMVLIASVLFGFASNANLGGGAHFARIASSPQMAVIVVLLAVPITALQLLIQNATVVFFPAWARPSKEEMRGFVAMGQRLLTMAGYLIVLSVGLLPAAAVFVPTLLVTQHMGGGPVAAALTTVLPIGVLVLEIVLGVKFLGGQLDKLDVSNDLDPQ